MKQKGISINLLSIGIFFLVAVILAFFGLEVRNAGVSVQRQMQIEENRRKCETESQILSDASDYLTSEVWHFAATKNLEHMENYWREVNISKRREAAVEHLIGLYLTEEETDLVKRAKRKSDELTEDEAWAMRLVSDSLGLHPEQMPARVAAVQYTQGEDLLTAEEKQKLATQYIFGEEYTKVKQEIMKSIDSFRELLQKRKNAELSKAAERTQEALMAVRILMIALIFAFLLEAVLFYYFLLHPFHFYTRFLNQKGEGEFTFLSPRGVREMRAFAGAFNQVYQNWQQQRRKLEQERHRFRVALENSSVIVYEYDFSSDTYTSYGSLKKKDGSAEQEICHFMKEYSEQLLGKEGLNSLQGMLSGENCSPVELQVWAEDRDSKRLWVRITGTPVYGEDHQIKKLIGKVTNIQEEKEKEFALEDAQSRDGLTGLYKREPGIRQVRGYMEEKSPEEICGIMLLDMDDFTQINEKEGQVFADGVLQGVADILREKTGPDDIQIRLGGDEFMLFIKNCPKSRATVLGPEIAREIQGLFADQNLKISASIGMCVTQVVDEYSGLYRCAESALNYVKGNGKGRAACYLDVSNDLGMMLVKMYPQRHFINEIERPDGTRDDLVSFALDLLGKAKNLDDAIFLLLARVGNVCRMDRVLIIGIDMEYMRFHYIYQWAATAADRMSREAHYFKQEEYFALSSAYDEEGLCDRRIINGPCEMKSILHAGIWNYGSCVGAMAFERREDCVWTPEERKILSELTKIISSFTLKAQADAVSQAKTDFLSRMSHEIRTPMNAISGMTVIARSVLDDPVKLLDCLNKIESANQYLLGLINDVLDMSRIESGKVEINLTATYMEDLLENVATLIRPQAEARKILFKVENDFHENRALLADNLRVNQVLVNLLGNAVKFTGEGGHITLKLETLQKDTREAALRFSVRDDGIGISKEAQERIFNAFEQASGNTASVYGGTGLGLAISSRLVKLMGGDLEVKSEKGKGSVFSFNLSFSYAEDGTEREKPEDIDDMDYADLRGKRLLLTEDNELNQEIAKEILSMNGFVLETASNGKEALTLFEQHEPGYYDAILMDIRMPVMDGMEATRRIRTSKRADGRTIPIIAMTANAFDEDMKKSMENGMDGHLSKPIDVDKLLHILKILIGK